MLEQMRRSSQSLIIYVLFGIVIAVFIVNFGPQSQGGCDQPASTASSSAAVVDGREITTQDFRYGYLLVGGSQYSNETARQRRLKETIMDKLIERELLAREGERLGFRVGDEEVEDLLAESKIIGLGFEQTLPVVQKDGRFDYELFKRFVQFQLNMSPRAFIEQQRRELMAVRVRQTLRTSVNVSDDEIKTDFVKRGNQVNVEYVRFPARRYEAQVAPTAAEVEAYVKANEKKLKETYDSRKFLYEKAPKERKLRQLMVKVDAAASPEAVEAAKKKAEALAARIRKGEAFAAVAKAASEDAQSKARGGDIGWKRQGATTLGTEIETKVWEAKDKELVGPLLKGGDGWYLVQPDGTREGDIPFDQVKGELAEDQLRQERAKAKAKADAEAALAMATKTSGKSLKDLFPAPADKKQDPKVETQGPLKMVMNTASDTPQAEETGLFMKRGTIVEGIGNSAELTKAVFDLKTEAPFGGPYEVAGSYVIVKLKERKQPDLADFDKRRMELLHDATMVKGEEVVEEWTQRTCVETKQEKKISVNRELLRYEAGPEGAVAYEPCTPQMRF